jgi:UDP-N-acetylmuramoylalanine--D-glutamate ligase
MILENKSFLILGGGITGNSVINLLRYFTNKIYIYDDNKNLTFDNVENLSNYNLKEYEDIQKLLKSHKFDYCIISPGFPRKSLIVKELEKNYVPVLGEMDFSYYVLFYYFKSKSYIIAITGTDGKSTTTNLIATLLRSQSINAVECGNYGIPFSDIIINFLQKKELPEALVMECSSYQLEDIRYFNADISIFLNIAEDHLDRYESMKEYLLAKLNIIPLYHKPNQVLIINQTIIELIKQFHLEYKLSQIETIIINEKNIYNEFAEIFNYKFSWKDFFIDSIHNRMNLLFSIKSLEHFIKLNNKEFNFNKFIDAIKNYKGLPYRLEKVKQIDNITFINDSKSTTVQSLISAIRNFQESIIFLLMGGLDKNLDFTPLKNLKIFQENRLYIFPYGASAEKIKNQLNLNHTYKNMEDAFNEAWNQLKRIKNSNDNYIILLSPACASFDQFKNYKERGEFFNQLVNKITI